MRQFTSPPDPTAFNRRVRDVVRRVPPSRVATYGQIARQIPLLADTLGPHIAMIRLMLRRLARA